MPVSPVPPSRFTVDSTGAALADLQNRLTAIESSINVLAEAVQVLTSVVHGFADTVEDVELLTLVDPGAPDCPRR